MKSFTSPTQTGRAACRCAEPALTRDRAFARIGTLQLTEKLRKKKNAFAFGSDGLVSDSHPCVLRELRARSGGRRSDGHRRHQGWHRIRVHLRRICVEQQAVGRKSGTPAHRKPSPFRRAGTHASRRVAVTSGFARLFRCASRRRQTVSSWPHA